MNNIRKIKSILKVANEVPRSIFIEGRRWFDRVNGNTYFSSQIFFDGELVHEIPFQYGYSDHYADMSFKWIVENNPQLPQAQEMESYHRYADRTGIKINTSVVDVPRKKDL